MDVLSLKNGINLRLPAYALPQGQCVYLQNLRVRDEVAESIDGTHKYHGTSLGSDPITAIIPYYNSETGVSKVLCASGGSIYLRDDAKNEFRSIKGGIQVNSIHSHATRQNVTYIPTKSNGMFKYLGGETIYTVGGGSTSAPNMTYIYYMREVDRIFGILAGQPDILTWCDFQQPEIWDGANVDRIKSVDGDILVGIESLYGKLILFKQYSIWIYYVSGNEENWKLELAPTTVGCIAPNTIKRVGNEIWFLGDSPRTGIGVYAFNGSTSRLLTDDVTPFLERINKSLISTCCAEYHNELYTLSFPLDASLVNNYSIDLDSVNVKEDGSPAIYGPHTFGFYSSAVLNTTFRSGEHLYGDHSDGFVYREGGSSFKSDNGLNGNLIQNRFLSAIHNDGKWDIMKFYREASIYLVPRGFTNVRFRLYRSFAPYAREYRFNQQANHPRGAIYGDFDAVEMRVFGTPVLHKHTEYLGVDSRGTSIQFELINDVVDQKIAFQGYGYVSEDIYETKQVQVGFDNQLSGMF